MVVVIRPPLPSSTRKNPPDVVKLTNNSSPAKKPLSILIVALASPVIGDGGVASGSKRPRPEESTVPADPTTYAAAGATLTSTGGSSTGVMLTTTLPLPTAAPPAPCE